MSEKDGDQLLKKSEETVDNENVVDTEKSNDDTGSQDQSSKEDFKKAVADEVEKVIKARIQREVDKSKKLQEEKEELEEKYSSLEASQKEAEEELQKTQYQNNVLSVAQETGFPQDVIKTLKGESKDELLEAAKLLETVAPRKSVDDLFEGKPRNKRKEQSLADIALAKYNKK